MAGAPHSEIPHVRFRDSTRAPAPGRPHLARTAACRGAADDDPDLFFPEADQLLQITEAKQYCARCPVTRLCLDTALETTSRHGIRGGLTEEEREPLHINLEHRLDYERVEAALGGRDIHLTHAERRAIVRTAHARGLSIEHLARILKVSYEHAEKLLRRARREARHRQLANDVLPTNPQGADAGPPDLRQAA